MYKLMIQKQTLKMYSGLWKEHSYQTE